MNRLLNKLRENLAGCKTYLVAGSAIIVTVIAWVEGAVEAPEAAKMIVAAVLAMTMRAGVAKAE